MCTSYTLTLNYGTTRTMLIEQLVKTWRRLIPGDTDYIESLYVDLSNLLSIFVMQQVDLKFEVWSNAGGMIFKYMLYC